MNKLLKLANYIDKLNHAMAIIARFCVIFMLSLGFWNVIGRYVGVSIGYNLSSNLLIEGQWYLFDLIFLLGLAWTLQKNGHVRVDILQGRWNKNTKIKIELLGTLLLLLPFSIGVFLISIDPVLHSWQILEASPDPNGLPRYLIKTIIPISFLLLSLQGIAILIRTFYELKTTKVK
tara:strand:- start:1066 stop:1593 length:528 start_codon:yes stop_codon:yes gene_type:complete